MLTSSHVVPIILLFFAYMPNSALQTETTPPSGAITTQPATTQPASRPPRAATLRKPTEARIISKLLNEPEQRPIQATDPDRPDTEPATLEGVSNLMLEGTILTERAGRLIATPQRLEFQFENVEGRGSQTMPLNRNQLLEVMEREALAGQTEFIVSGEVSRYKHENWLTLRKVVKRVRHGNLGP